ncbi:MAG: SUMF1/EgtB/PvdO family nonheme iron enzyme [Planctomycetaceae bacterium]
MVPQAGLSWWNSVAADASVGWLVGGTIRASLLLLVAAALCALLRRRSAAVRHLVWVSALAATLVMPVLSAVLPEWQVLPEWIAAANTSPAGVSEAAAARSQPGAFALSPTPAAPRAPLGGPIAESDEAPPPDTPHVVAVGPLVLLTVWALGAALMLATLLRGTRRVTRAAASCPTLTTGPLVDLTTQLAARLGLAAPTIHLGPAGAVPMVWGLLRSRLLLPAEAAEWAPASLSAVITHELAHLRRRDLLTLLVAHVARAAQWFNPLAWYAVGRVRVEQEQACDDFVLREGMRPSEFAAHLVDVASRLAPAPHRNAVAVAIFDSSKLETRVRTILDKARNCAGLTRGVRALLVTATCAAAVLLSVLRVGAEPEAAKANKAAGDTMVGKEAGQVRDDNGLKMKFVWCPPGAFTMEQVDRVGASTTVTPVNVFLTRGYWLGKYEVTQSEWKDVMKSEPWKGQDFMQEGADFAVAFVNWDGATQFCRTIKNRERLAGRLPEGWEYTLPTEAQWERACRARTETKYSFGDDPSEIDAHAWFSGNAWENREHYAHRVGQKKPNPWGLHDMHGNVWEWCRDYWAEEFPGGLDPEVTNEMSVAGSEARENIEEHGPGGPIRAMRGPSWFNTAPHCGSAARAGIVSNLGSLDIGFRVALQQKVAQQAQLSDTADVKGGAPPGSGKGGERPEEPAASDEKPDGGSDLLRRIRRESAPILAAMAREHGYGLESGQYLRRVAPPFPAIRLDYYRTAHAETIRAPPGAMVFHWKDDRLENWGLSFGDYSLGMLLDALLELKSQFIEGPKDLFAKEIPGDWVIRPGLADAKQVAVKQLERILNDELSLSIRLRFREVEREVYVAEGNYHHAPLPGREGKGKLILTDETREIDRIEIYGKELVPNSGGGGGSGPFPMFLDWLGRWISTPIVSEVKSPPADWLGWVLHAQEPVTPKTEAEDHDPKLVLPNISAQTGLTFKRARRPVEILFVESAK